MTTVGSYEAKTHLPRLLQQVERGQEFVITRRGVPIALLTFPQRKNGIALEHVGAAMLLYRDTEKRTLGKLTARAMREEGRRY